MGMVLIALTTLQLGSRHLPWESLEVLGLFTLDQRFSIRDSFVTPSYSVNYRIMKVWEQLGADGVGGRSGVGSCY